MDGTASPAGPASDEAALLGIYLNDHLAGATGGLDLFRRAAGAHRGSAYGEALRRLAGEVAEDRSALLEMIQTLGVPIRHYKLYAAWALEKVGRLKPNGRLVQRSPLSSLVELEAMRLGVEGKAAGWRTLRVVAKQDSRLDANRLDKLIDRACRQAETLEALRIRCAAEIFTGSTPGG